MIHYFLRFILASQSQRILKNKNKNEKSQSRREPFWQ
jgi:hypothetical protein